jgi:hypothetical protein
MLFGLGAARLVSAAQSVRPARKPSGFDQFFRGGFKR